MITMPVTALLIACSQVLVLDAICLLNTVKYSACCWLWVTCDCLKSHLICVQFSQAECCALSTTLQCVVLKSRLILTVSCFSSHACNAVHAIVILLIFESTSLSEKSFSTAGGRGIGDPGGREPQSNVVTSSYSSVSIFYRVIFVQVGVKMSLLCAADTR